MSFQQGWSEFYAALSKRGGTVSSAEVAELVAALEAIKFALDAGFRDVELEGNKIAMRNAIELEGDKIAVMNAIWDGETGWSRVSW